MLEGKIIVITGASSGIGKALAVRVARDGAIAVIAARRREKLDAVAGEIRRAGGTTTVIECDVSRRASAEALIEETLRGHGHIDILVNNAGRGNLATVEETTDEMLQKIFAVNVFSLWNTVRPALRHMRARGSGHIVMVSSMAGALGFPFNSAYVAAKHAVVGFTRALRAELVGSGIHASVILPGGVDTEFAAVTEGGPMGPIFAEAAPIIRRIAAERGLPLVPVEGVLTPDEVAARIVECLHHPAAEVYTHDGAAAFAALAVRNREEAELLQRAAVLGETEAYVRLKERNR